MAMLVIQTQVYENYGAHDWDGTGFCPEYWKPKSGNEYKLLNVDLSANLAALVDGLRAKIECNDNYFHEYIIDWFVESDDYLTYSEQLQIKLHGKVQRPSSRFLAA